MHTLMSFSPPSNKFPQPLLIYDDKCSSCTKFAKAAEKLSRGWIRIAGHYFSQEAIDTKKMVFPPYYDPTKMFWLINKKGAFGARSGLFQTIREIIRGIFKGMSKSKHVKDYDSKVVTTDCSYSDRESCMSTRTTLNRMCNMMRNSDKFDF
jgi:hypothetical protein